MWEEAKKMRNCWSNLILCTIIATTHLSGRASSETASSDDVNHKRIQMQDQQQQPQQMQQFQHYPMSCYVCSTIDYENSMDNICRVMKSHPRLPTGLHPQSPSLVNVGHHSPSMMNYPMTTSTTPPLSYSTTPTMEALVSGSHAVHGYQNESGSSSSWLSSQSVIGGQQYSNDTGHLVGANSTNLGQQQTSLAPVQHGYYSRLHRLPPPSNHVRSRACLDDENYCSTVSVVRIEFVNDVWVSKFWALERNCSKSCNTGCMIIGEKVRLRVCSQCCKHPNCNVGSGAPALFNLDSIQLVVSLSIISAAFFRKLNKLEVAPPDGQLMGPY